MTEQTKPAKNQAESHEKPMVDPNRWLAEHGDVLFNFALRRLNRHELAEEAVQETLVAAIRSIKDYSGIASERTWLVAILRRKICDQIRDTWRNTAKVSLDDEAHPEARLFDANGRWREMVRRTSGSPSESRELQEIVQQCLRQLPSIQAKIFVLRILEEKKSEEICQELGISATNYWTRLYRARLGLAKCVSDKWPMP